MRALGLLVLLLVAASAGAQSIEYYPGGAWGRLYLSPDGTAAPGALNTPLVLTETLGVTSNICDGDSDFCSSFWTPVTITPANSGNLVYPYSVGLLGSIGATGDYNGTSVVGMGLNPVIGQASCNITNAPCYLEGSIGTARIDAAGTGSYATGLGGYTRNNITTGTATNYEFYAVYGKNLGASNHVGIDYNFYAFGSSNNADVWDVFKFYAAANVGRNLFTISGACGGSDCRAKTTVPGYALGGFAVEARGGRGVLMAGSAGQWQVIDEGAKPTCDVDRRGAYWHEFGGTGVKDTVEVCAKDAGDAYAWRTIY